MPTIRSLPLAEIFRSRKRLRRELLETRPSNPVRIAVLGGTTTNEVVDLLELLLLDDGFAPTFYQSEYNRFYEDATLDVARVAEFRPDVVCIHTHVVNITRFPRPDFGEAELDARVTEELDRYRAIWRSLRDHVGCHVIQNNFEHPPFAPMGNLGATVAGGGKRFVSELNRAFARAGAADPRLLIHDIETIAATIGHARWFDWQRWYNYKIWTTPEGSYELASSLAAQIGALRGRSRKCLVLDLDNTLWGGVIGDDGIDKLQIGKETGVAEAYTAFQRYCLSLRELGVILAVCSKNDEAIARSGFSHPSSLLKLEHFSAFQANWEPKCDTIQRIAADLNIGLDSLVFVDDNPAERAIVKAQLPAVAVPDVGSDVAHFPGIIQAGRYFEMVSLSKEDLVRADAYATNDARRALQGTFNDYGEYLDSLQMVAEIAPFQPVYLERITQLINKTNQFNLTTRRYTVAEVEQISTDPHFVTLYGRLTDTFGDNGLISVIIGRLDGRSVHIDLWIMSCRVLKRDMEMAMLDALVERARAAGATELVGCYSRTPKNAMVSEHYPALGFERMSPEEDADRSMWRLKLAGYVPRNRHIEVKTPWIETASSSI